MCIFSRIVYFVYTISFLYFQATKLTRASNIIIWNRWFLTCLGMWPTKVNQFLFTIFIAYMITYCTMAVNHLINHINYPEHIVANLAANILLLMILGKMCICRRSCGIMTKFLKIIEKDFLTKSYDNAQEKIAYLHYNEIALSFVKFSMAMVIIAATLYYCKVFYINWDPSKYSFSHVKLEALYFMTII